MNCSGDATKRGRRGIALCAFVSGHKAGHNTYHNVPLWDYKTPPSGPGLHHGDLFLACPGPVGSLCFSAGLLPFLGLTIQSWATLNLVFRPRVPARPALRWS